VPEKWPKRSQTPPDAFDLSSGEAGSGVSQETKVKRLIL